jgi:hypothetical protein
LDSGILHRLLPCFHCQRTEVAVGKGSKRSFSDADYGDGSHVIRIARKGSAMTVTIDSRLDDRLLEKAAAEGMTVPAYVERLVESG